MKTLYEVNWHYNDDTLVRISVSPIRVLREGILPGCSGVSIAAGEMSMPMASQPCWASQIASPPSPHPRSKARPGVSAPATLARFAFTRPDQTAGFAEYRPSQNSVGACG